MKRTETTKEAIDIFPPQVMDNSIYDHFNQHYSRSQYLYRSVLGLISICFFSLFFIKVPISIQSDGILTEMDGTADGTPAELSPDSLIASVYVNPADIGFIREGMEVVMRVDAYDFNLWGTVHGVVSDISGDVNIDDGTPLFTVSCSLNSHSLKLQNGYTGVLKKGMTLQAGFHITERTAFQLLYDKVDDWMNAQADSKPLN